MPSEITMPQLSDTMSEGTLVKWRKKVGDTVKAGEEIADVETDKATMPMEAFESGTLAHIAAREGDKIKVGELLGVIALSGENLDEVKKNAGSKSQVKASAGASGAGSSEVENGRRPQEVGRAQARQESVHEDAATTSESLSRQAVALVQASHARGAGDSGNGGGRIRVSPLARRIAGERGIDLKLITGSGPNGRIVQQDILSFKADVPRPGAPAASGKKKDGPPPISLKPKVAAGQKHNVPHTKIRTVIAQRLQQSKQQLPHFYETIDVDVENLSALRAQMNRALESEGIRLSIGDLIAKAVSHALLVHPGLNAHYMKDEIIRYGDVNLGMAVALPDGLIVPVLRGINQMNLRDVRSRTADLIDRARRQNLKQNELTGATFTVSNLGTHGIREFSAIINPPEVGILAIGAAEARAVVRNGQIVARQMMTLTLSADHRAVDGAGAAEFLQTLKMLLEEPGMMLV
jgi:pyruvate dehydrogenase E2 component (dihydrolipoamide acetyltransferase)